MSQSIETRHITSNLPYLYIYGGSGYIVIMVNTYHVWINVIYSHPKAFLFAMWAKKRYASNPFAVANTVPTRL